MTDDYLDEGRPLIEVVSGEESECSAAASSLIKEIQYDDSHVASVMETRMLIQLLSAALSVMFVISVLYHAAALLSSELSISPSTSVSEHSQRLAAWRAYSHAMAVNNNVTNQSDSACVPHSMLPDQCHVPAPDHSIVTRIDLAMTICGDGILPMALTALKSYYFHRHSSVNLTVHLLSDKPDTHQQWFNQSISKDWPPTVHKHVHLQFHNVSALHTNHSQYLDMFKQCSTVRLFLTELLPPSVDAVLYVDADTLVLSDYRSVWGEFQVMNEYQAIALAWEGNGIGGRSWYVDRVKENFPWVKPYGLNAGVALLNLTRLRSIGFVDDVCDIMKRDRESPKFELGDQDVLNQYFAQHQTDDVLSILPPAYNWRSNSPANSAGGERGASIIHMNDNCAFKALKKDVLSHLSIL